MIKNDALRAYADLLENTGFDIYEPRGTWNFFVYSQPVDGVECFGIVQYEGRFLGAEGFQHTMPIKPSREHGSSMWVEGVKDEATVEAANAVAQPSNYNRLVGTHKNYRDPRDDDGRFTKR